MESQPPHRLAPFLIMRAAVPHDVVTKKRFPSATHTLALLSPKEKPNRWTCPKTPLKRPNGLSGEGRCPDGDHAGLPPAYHSSSLREGFPLSSLVPVLFLFPKASRRVLPREAVQRSTYRIKYTESSAQCEVYTESSASSQVHSCA